MSGITSRMMNLIDENSDYLGVKRLVLMENAGANVARAICSRANVKGRRVVVVAYIGNKGGDGFVTARHLASMGAKVTVILLSDPNRIVSEEARINWRILENMEYTVETITVEDIQKFLNVRDLIIDADVVVDAMLGTGVRGELRDPIRAAVNAINNVKGKALIVSIDIPTGLNPDTGEIHGVAVKADITVTHHKPKIGLLTNNAKEYTGEVIVSSIGIPLEAELFTGPGDIRQAIKPRYRYAHKGDYGRILIIGGSKEFSGAPALAALASLRTGADIAVVAAPETVANVIRGFSPSIIVKPLPCSYLNTEALSELPEIDRYDVIVLGPGLGVKEEVFEACFEVVKTAKEKGKPMVIDADAIKALGKDTSVIHGVKAILTPHVGEFYMLSGIKLPDEGNKGWIERIDIVRNIAARLNTTILLKSHYDIISDGEHVKINRTGNPAMTVGGTGDVLTGITSTFLAWTLDPFKSACAGAFTNGVLGDYVRKNLGNHILPTDLIDAIPKVLAEYDLEI